MDLQALLDLMNGTNLEKIAEQLNVSNSEIKKGLSEAVPSILDALGKNSVTKEGAEELDKALVKHDGSILNNIVGYLANPNLSEGAGILGHIFGENTQNVASAVSKVSGINLDGSVKLLQLLAPIVMGTLGKLKKDTNLNASNLNNLINIANVALKSQNGGLEGLMSAFSGALDKDGNVANDLLNLAGNLFGKK